VDGVVVYPPAGDGALHDIGIATWAEDGSRFVFIEALNNAERRRLMIASADGRSVKELLTPSSPSEAHWLSDGHLLVMSEDGYQIMDPDDGSARSVDRDKARRWLYVTVNEKSFPVQDRLCRH
jgi:hypothetical protein